MKVSFPSGLFVGALIVLVLGGLRMASAQTTPPIPTPPPLVTSGETLPGNVSVSTPKPPGPSPARDNAPAVVRATPPHPHPGGPMFQGAVTCSSSLCHGGGGGERDSYTIWNKSDPHKHAAATLAGTRATRIAQGLALPSAAGSVRCTECHEPLAGVPEERLTAKLDVREEGVSCESCHGAAQNWMRSHTRRDFTHAQNVQTGVRELRSLYARANSCVACHQVLASDILTAGHPPLLFELDAQTVAEPRHWHNDVGDYFGPQSWLTGQAVALREMSWSLSQNTQPVDEEREQWRALLWLLQRTVESRGEGANLPGFDAVPNSDAVNPGNVARAQATADDFARAASRLEWSRGSVRRCVEGLTGLDKEFRPVAGGEGEMALRLRAQRLALALSRLMAPLQKQDADKWKLASMELDKLFTAADARAVFDGTAFAVQLQHLHDEFAKVAAD